MLESETYRPATDLLEAVTRPIAHGIWQLQDEPAVRRKDERNVENPVPSAAASRDASGDSHFVGGQLEFAGILGNPGRGDAAILVPVGGYTRLECTSVCQRQRASTMGATEASLTVITIGSWARLPGSVGPSRVAAEIGDVIVGSCIGVATADLSPLPQTGKSSIGARGQERQNLARDRGRIPSEAPIGVLRGMRGMRPYLSTAVRRGPPEARKLREGRGAGAGRCPTVAGTRPAPKVVYSHGH